VATQYLQAWFYHAINATNQITLTDSGGGPVTFTLTSSQVFSDALAELESLADADATLNGAYTFSFSTSTGAITLACDETFTYSLSSSMATMLGFSNTTQSGATSYVSDLQPHAFRVVQGAGYDVPQAMDAVDLREYRHNRSVAYATHNGRRVPFYVVDEVAEFQQLYAGPLLNGKVRLHHTASASPYSLTNLDGYLDLYVKGIESTRLFGSQEQWGEIRLIGSLDEG
jgi:hypothetical protein